MTYLRDDTEPDPNAGNWSHTDLLLAALYDAVMHVAWITASANSQEKVEHPVPMPRPGVDRPRPRVNPAAVAYLSQFRDDLARRQAEGAT